MKRILAFLLAALTVLAQMPAIYAADNTAYDVKFRKHGGGQYIYCNNPEYVAEKNFSSYDNPDASYLMNNESLEAGEYTMFFCFYNWSAVNVEPDVEFKSKDGAKVRINSIGYYIPYASEYWDCLGAWADFLGVDIRPTNATEQYVHYTGNKPVPAEFEVGNESVWASRYIYNYAALPPKVTFNMLINFTIEEGTADVNCAALKSSGILGDRSMHNPNAKPGRYVNDSTVKGIDTESLPIVEADFDINITPETENEKNLNVKVYNSYYPQGNLVPYWITNINPSCDASRAVINASAESDIMNLTYKDDEKLSYYGTGVPQSSKDNIWRFDTSHHNTLEYKAAYGGEKENYCPNGEVTAFDIQNPPRNMFNLGNFGVTNRYNITLTNTDSVKRTLNYYIESSCSSNIVIARDEEGRILNPYTLTEENPYALNKYITWGSQNPECMFSAEVEPGETKKYILDVILPTNTFGGQKNFFKVSAKSELLQKETSDMPVYDRQNEFSRVFFNGIGYMKWDDTKLLSYDAETKEWSEVSVPKSAKEIFEENDYEIRLVKTDTGYAGKYSVWDDYADWVIDDKNYKNEVYFFDKNLNYLYSKEFDGYVYDIVHSDHTLYVQAANSYQSEDNTYKNFVPLEDSTALPVFDGNTTLLRKGWPFYRRNKGEGAKLILFEREIPASMYATDGLFYYKKSYMEYTTDFENENIISVSYDGVNWTDITLPQRLLELVKVYHKDGKIYVVTKYETFEYDEVKPADAVVMLNRVLIAFDEAPEIKNDRTMVPLRFLAEQLGAEVTWNDAERTVTIKRDKYTITLAIGSDKAVQNGEEEKLDCAPYIKGARTMIPLRFVSKYLGCKVKWDADTKLVTITGDI